MLITKALLEVVVVVIAAERLAAEAIVKVRLGVASRGEGVFAEAFSLASGRGRGQTFGVELILITHPGP